MAVKTVPVLQNLDNTDIWYCEAGDKHIYLGLVEKEDGSKRFIQVIAKSLEQAFEEIGESGDVLLVAPLREILSDFVVTPHHNGRAQVH